MSISGRTDQPKEDPEIEINAPALGKDALLFARLDGREELGRLYSFQVVGRGKSADSLDVSKEVLGSSVTVSMKRGTAPKRHFNGILTRFSRGRMEGRYLSYNLELRPKLWLATRNAGCRIFEQRTVVQILEFMFQLYGLKVSKKLKETYTTRNYCVQYRETDFNFVSRLMEEEGIYYYFTHDEQNHTLVLCDGIQAHEVMRGGTLTWVGAVADGNLRDDVMLSWHQEFSLQPNSYEHADFEFQQPSAQLWTLQKQKESPGSTAPRMAIRDYPGAYNDLPGSEPAVQQMKARGEHLAKMRVQEFGTQELQGEGTSNSRDVDIGTTFTLEREMRKTEWLVTGTSYHIDFGEHESTAGTQAMPGFTAHMQAIPKATPYRAPRTTPRPLLQGPQTAIVVQGADGGAVDKYGRVKVRFHWTKQGESQQGDSCWVRVSQGWAGKNFGMMALPRVGQEVVVSFLDGDPDRPLVTGRVYNAESMPPYALPDQATVTGILGRSFGSTTATDANELRFDDKAGAEYLWLQAQRDYHLNVRNNAVTTVDSNTETTVGANSTTSIGSNSALTIGQNASATIGSEAHLDVGADTLVNIGGGMQLNVGAAQAVAIGSTASFTVGSSGDIHVGAGLNVTAGAAINLVAGAPLVIESSATITLKAGGSTIVLASSGITITGGTVAINSGGGAGPGTKAQKANPPKPKKAEKPKEHKDPVFKDNPRKKAP